MQLLGCIIRSISSPWNSKSPDGISCNNALCRIARILVSFAIGRTKQNEEKEMQDAVDRLYRDTISLAPMVRVVSAFCTERHFPRFENSAELHGVAIGRARCP
jgi:hypothetical protein